MQLFTAATGGPDDNMNGPHSPSPLRQTGPAWTQNQNHDPCSSQHLKTHLVSTETFLRRGCSLHGHHPDGHDDLWESFLPLHRQDLQAGLGHDDLHDVQVAADAAVDGVQLAALPRHVVLDDEDAVGAEALLAANQEVQQVFVCQVAWRKRGRAVSWVISDPKSLKWS